MIATRIIPADHPDAIPLAVTTLQSGSPVALPTETVYGLAAHALNPEAVAKIFAVKERPLFDPLILHIADELAARPLVLDWPDIATTLTQALWPGPLTILLPKAPQVPDLVTSGLPTVGLRCPDHHLTLAILRQLNAPLAAPSANRFGRISPTTAAHVLQELDSRIPLILDGGTCRVGIESTILDLTTPIPTLRRPGAITQQQIETILGFPIQTLQSQSARPSAPGELAFHYAPRTPLRLLPHPLTPTTPVPPQSALLLFSHCPDNLQHHPHRILAPDHSTVTAATRLFASLRELDQLRPPLILAEPPPLTHLGPAILDRLTRASHT